MYNVEHCAITLINCACAAYVTRAKKKRSLWPAYRHARACVWICDRKIDLLRDKEATMSTTSKTTPPYSTPPRDIPDRVNSEQATENDNGSSLLLVSCSEKNNVSPFLYQSLPTSSFSASLRPRLSTAAAAVSFDNEEHHNEDAAPYLTDSPNESESHRENTTDRNGETQNQHAAVDTPEENLTTAHQVVETDSDNEKTEMVIITDDFNSKSLISTYCEIKMEAAEKKQKQQNDDDVRPRLQSVLPDINAAKSSCEQEAQIFQMDGDDLHHFEDNVDHTAAANMSSIPVNFQIDDDEIISVTDNMISSDIRTIRSGNTTRHTPPESETSDTNSDRSSADTREGLLIISSYINRGIYSCVYTVIQLAIVMIAIL